MTRPALPLGCCEGCRTEQATLDVERIALFIAADNPAAAQRLARELLVAGDSLTVFPNRGRHGRLAGTRHPAPGTRQLVAVYPYVIIYSVGAGAVDILPVWHGAQER